jgi:Asp-tRNA(Asn)/Glu-tRNA(Gln) amidotransferase C subunit
MISMDFLFHNLSEKDREEIKKQVDSILQSFSKKLSEIKKDIGESNVEREEFEREEDGKPSELDRKIMFENAPEKNDDFIIGERKKW